MPGVKAPEEYLTTEQFAEILQVPLKTARLWLRDGSGPPSAKFGRHIRLRRSDVDRWAADRFAGTTSTPSNASASIQAGP